LQGKVIDAARRWVRVGVGDGVAELLDEPLRDADRIVVVAEHAGEPVRPCR
jgi:hypothetical protein